MAAETPGSLSSGPPERRPPNYTKQFGAAMELPFLLVIAVLLGGFLGYWLDRWLHTKPILMIVFGGVGLFAGVRDVIRRFPGGGDGNQGA